MYSDTIKVANKIITNSDLEELFASMQEKLVYYRKISANEEMKNNVLDYQYRRWSFKDNGSALTFNVNFYDDTSIQFDNYENFMSIFNTRLDEIKDIHVRLLLSYGVKDEIRNDYYHQSISMWIYENKMNIDVALKSDDKKLDDIYELIKNKVLNAPVRYDEVIKKKSSIKSRVGLAI